MLMEKINRVPENKVKQYRQFPTTKVENSERKVKVTIYTFLWCFHF